MAKRKIKPGSRFHNLVVIEEANRITIDPRRRQPRVRYAWRCKCKCGNRVVVLAENLLRGQTKACGCLNATHGMSESSEYKSWQWMKHEHKGMVCRRWGKFENFIADMGKRPSRKHHLARKNQAKDFSLNNCYWEKLPASSRIIEFNGVRLNIAQWAKRLGIPDTRLRSRLQYGWSVERALGMEPLRYEKRNRLIRFNGCEKTLAQWCKRLGLNYQTVNTRLHRGWSVNLALATATKVR